MTLPAGKSVQAIRHAYQVRVSARAKHMRLRVSLQKGIEVVVPGFMSKKQVQNQVPDFVREQQQWIDSVLEKLKTEARLYPSVEACSLPELIELKALGQTFRISYRLETGNKHLKLSQDSESSLHITGNIDARRAVFQRLERFFKSYAGYFIQARLDQYSQQFNLPYQRLTVRAQKTRWGSCSSRKTISLNYRLIFLPEYLMDYVILHELAHLRHMNHSKHFWAHLETMIPDARGLDRQLAQASKQLPDWVVLA